METKSQVQILDLASRNPRPASRALCALILGWDLPLSFHSGICPWAFSGNQEQLLCRNVELFRGGLVFKAHRLLYRSTLGSRVIKKKRRFRTESLDRSEAHKIKKNRVAFWGAFGFTRRIRAKRGRLQTIQ